MFTLFTTLIICGFLIIDMAIGTFDKKSGYGLLDALYICSTAVPSLAVTVRRLHDIGRSGWWFLLGLIPIVGAIVLLVFMVTDSQAGANRYGPNPKEVAV